MRHLDEMAEALAQSYEDRQIETREALFRFQDIAEQAARSEEERKRMGLEKNAFAVYTVLKSYVQGLKANQANLVDAIFREYPDYCWDDNQASLRRRSLYNGLPFTGQLESAYMFLRSRSETCRANGHPCPLQGGLLSTLN